MLNCRSKERRTIVIQKSVFKSESVKNYSSTVFLPFLFFLALNSFQFMNLYLITDTKYETIIIYYYDFTIFLYQNCRYRSFENIFLFTECETQCLSFFQRFFKAFYYKVGLSKCFLSILRTCTAVFFFNKLPDIYTYKKIHEFLQKVFSRFFFVHILLLLFSLFISVYILTKYFYPRNEYRTLYNMYIHIYKYIYIYYIYLKFDFQTVRLILQIGISFSYECPFMLVLNER